MGPLSVEEVLAEEADKLRVPGQQAELVAELKRLATDQDKQSSRLDKDADERSGKDEEAADVKKRKDFYCALNKLNRAALCCSGGGIRSATFCLGVIQGLAKFYLDDKRPPKPLSDLSEDELPSYANDSLLSRFHYLSTVSGGGYIGSWLSAWRTRNDFPTVWESLSGRPDGPDVEPAEISWLRAYSNYLTPRVGLASADTWSGVAIYLRNLTLNWLVIVPAIAVVLLVLKFFITGAVAVARDPNIWGLDFVVALIGVACLIKAQAFTTKHRPTRRMLAGSDPEKGPYNVEQGKYIWGDLIWSLISAFFLTSALTSVVGTQFAGCVETHTAIFSGAAIGLVIHAFGWLAGNPLHWRCKDLNRWAASGLVYGGLVGFGVHLYAEMMPYTNSGNDKVAMILWPVILGVPWIMISQLFAESVFVGLVSYETNSDSDREWLGRAAGWVAATAIIWILTTVIAFAGGYLLIDFYGKVVAPYITAAGGVTGVITAWLSKSAVTPVKSNDQKPTAMQIAHKIGIAIAGPLFAAILVVGISVGLDLLLLGDSLIGGLAGYKLDTGFIILWLIVGFIAALIVATIASRCVNINRFSIHALYRNRLVRAYLGATRQKRCPDKFTAFDDKDNFGIHALWPPQAPKKGQNTFCLFHVVNITLNVVKTARLAWQERKAESFTASPLHCGAAYKGFRKSIEYAAGSNGDGLSLGTAMAISGAAASPNMGYHSSPSITLLLALFNVRLGWWLGNPGKEGNDTYKQEGPTTAIIPLVEETFGQTTDDNPWVYLSDGGHFENLGLYEMVRRRCRFILVIDAGCDPDFAFEDLGNAVRKIHIDLGVRVEFKDIKELKNRPPETVSQDDRNKIPYHAIGQIHYADADGDPCKDGWVLYLKPAIHFSDSEGAALSSYAAAQKTFPHETTADQWFTESQFESYRALGLDVIADYMQRGGPDFGGKSLRQFLLAMSPTVHD